jgi:hypothetical protein
MSQDPRSPVEYARRLYDVVLAWYRSADTKAQVILGIDGAFLSFLTAAMFAEPKKLSDVFAKFHPATWCLLALMVVALVLSMLAAVCCLWSRIRSRSCLRTEVEAAVGQATSPQRYPPRVMLFFDYLTELDPVGFRHTLLSVDDTFEVEVIAADAQELARNVRKKHIAVNAGFALSGATFCLFLLAGVSYVVAIRWTG